jgi:L-ascorbate metabolism protein UlaG (beta-lactamase superfamily)
MIRVTYINGPTALLEYRGLRLLTDPTFDPAGTAYELPAYTLRKLTDPAIAAADIGHIDAVLLSHDHHFDNLDRSGRALLPRADRVLTTHDGADRLGGGATGLAPGETTELPSMRVTATPARHGPEGGDRGPVIGFLLDEEIWFSGDTVWYDGVQDLAARATITVALLCLGAAVVKAAGEHPLTFTAAEAVSVARAMPKATIVPLHFEGWEHFSQSREDVEREFAAAGLADRLRWPPPGQPLELPTSA